MLVSLEGTSLICWEVVDVVIEDFSILFVIEFVFLTISLTPPNLSIELVLTNSLLDDDLIGNTSIVFAPLDALLLRSFTVLEEITFSEDVDVDMLVVM